MSADLSIKTPESSSASPRGSHEDTGSWWSKTWDYVSSWFSSSTSQDSYYHYPPKSNRYRSFGWNKNHQYCYTEEDLQLAAELTKKYVEIFGQSAKNPFEFSIEKRFYDWWTCTQPVQSLPTQFTLPNREARDASSFPIWHLADNMAKHIANLQAKRIQNQNKDLMNDPTMLVLQNLKELFFNDLVNTGCKEEEIDKIAKIQSYVKQVLHLVPSFGPDRTQLLEIQKRLNVASQAVGNCIANKNLPDLLSDIIIRSRSLENTLGTYLQFLLIDEEVAENFSSDFTENDPKNYQLSPVAKAYQNTLPQQNKIQSHALTPFQTLNRFYELIPIPDSTKVQLKLRDDALKNIKFASFVTPEQKQNYLATLASMEWLINIRKTFEEFKNIQSSIGTYIFAKSYLHNTDALVMNVQTLIDQTFKSGESLIQSADQGLAENLKNENQNHQPSYFENNLKALDNQFAIGTTTIKQLAFYCQKVQESMKAYQSEMKHLALSYDSGEAKEEVNANMQKLLMQINSINQLLGAQLNKNELIINNPNLFGLETTSIVCDIEKDENCLATQPLPSTSPVFLQNTETHEAETTQEKITENKIHTPTESNDTLAQIMSSSLHGFCHGILRGSTHVLEKVLRSKKWSEQAASYLSQLSYYSLLFSYHFYAYEHEQQDDTSHFAEAALHAAWITGQTWAFNLSMACISYLFNKVSERLKQAEYTHLASATKNFGNLTKFGIFAYDATQQGLVNTGAALLSGTAGQMAVETLGKKLLRS